MQRKNRLKVINLFGAPGRGKSSVRSGLFWLMKSHHLSVEEVSEYAKYLVLTGQTWQLKEEQLHLFSKQHHKQLIIERNGYEYAATDSPLQLSSFYAPDTYYKQFDAMVDEATDRFDNINFFLTRDVTCDSVEFEDRGRDHTLAQSLEVESKMRDFLAGKNIKCIELEVDIYTPWKIMDQLAPGLAQWPEFKTRHN